MSRLRRILLSSLTLVLLHHADTIRAQDAVPLHGRFERELRAAADLDSPQAVVLRVDFHGPGDRRQAIDGFWDGGRDFRFRFMPTAVGTWTFETTSSPRVEGLHGVKGRFQCREADEDNPLLTRGPIRVSGTGRHFEHADGAPFLWLADTAWNGALKSRRADWESYLDDRRKKGFTAVQFVTTQWRAAYTNVEGEVAYRGRDPVEILPAFYRRIDERIDAVNAAGLLAVPVLLWDLGDPAHTPGELPESQAVRLARYQVARYGAHHVAWFLPGDGDYFGENAERWKRIGRAVFDRPGHAPVFLHPRGKQWPFDAFLDERWVSAFGYQSGHGDGADDLRWIFEGPPARKWSREPARPVINLEPPYEDHVAYDSREPHSSYNVRRAIYWSLLSAPVAGVSYGAHGVWSWETEPAEPLNHRGSGVAKPWHEAIDLEGSGQLRHLVDMLRSMTWWTLEPDGDLVEVDHDEDDAFRHVSASGSPSTKEAIVYLPKGGTVKLAVDRLRSAYRAEWLDPRTGERTEAKKRNGHRYTAPDDRDWVLILR